MLYGGRSLTTLINQQYKNKMEKKEFEHDFNMYYSNLMHSDKITTTMKLSGVLNFYHLPENMKWGVYVDFFDSVGIHIGIRKTQWIIDYNECVECVCVETTRPEAREKALEKAIQIYEHP